MATNFGTKIAITGGNRCSAAGSDFLKNTALGGGVGHVTVLSTVQDGPYVEVIEYVVNYVIFVALNAI